MIRGTICFIAILACVVSCAPSGPRLYISLLSDSEPLAPRTSDFPLTVFADQFPPCSHEIIAYVEVHYYAQKDSSTAMDRIHAAARDLGGNAIVRWRPKGPVKGDHMTSSDPLPWVDFRGKPFGTTSYRGKVGSSFYRLASTVLFVSDGCD